MSASDSDTEPTNLPGVRVKGPRPSGSDFPPGTWVERYVVLDALGKGAMGAVYSAYDSDLDRRVALKFLRKRGPDLDEWHARMIREAKAMARLSHPNVVTLYEVGLSNEGRVFLAMEFVEGGTLGDWLQEEKRGWRAIVAMFCEAGEGLAAAHRAGMIHRDFKLDNVLVGKDGRPRVTDFGLARGTAEPSIESAPRSADDDASGSRSVIPTASGSLSKLTLTGTMMGTPGYMAPEQYTNDVEIDARADVFAFCATLYRALYGERAFAGATVEELADATIAGRVRDAPKGSEVPTWVRKVLLRGLAPERADRPASLGEVLAALRADPAKRRRRWMIAAGAALTAAAIALGVREAGAARVRECRRMADRLGGVWDGPRKEAIAKALRATGLAGADETWGRVEKRLDAYAAAWSAATEQACAATRVRGEQSEAMLDLRTACLDERLDELRALSDLLASADAKAAQKAVQAASALPSLEPCSNVDRLSVATRLPSEPGARAAIRALQGEIAEARELRVTGKQTQSWERLQRMHDRVEAAGYGPALVAWTMAVAADDVGRDLKTATREWREAIALAETYRLDREKAESQVRLGGSLDDLGDYQGAHEWLGLAQATLTRIGGDAQLALMRDVNEGEAYVDESKYAAAVPILEHAIARAAADGVDDPLDVSNAHSFLGVALAYDATRFADAVSHARSAVTILEDGFGPQHLYVAAMDNDLATVEKEAGRLDDALAAASRGIAIFEGAIARGELSATHANLGSVLVTKGEVLARLGRWRESIDALEAGERIHRANGRDEALVESDVALAEAWRRLGSADDAARVAAEARAQADRAKPSPDVLVNLLALEASLALDRGQGDEGLAIAERAFTLAQTGVSSLYDGSNARFVLARALARTKGNPARARALAEEARAGFATLNDARRAAEAAALAGETR